MASRYFKFSLFTNNPISDLGFRLVIDFQIVYLLPFTSYGAIKTKEVIIITRP